jgi:sulfur carrier protein ThiS
MKIDIHLHGLFRDYLPLEAKGRATLDLPPGSTAADLLAHLDIQRRAIVAVNDAVEVAPDHILRDGDDVAIFGVSGGG